MFRKVWVGLLVCLILVLPLIQVTTDAQEPTVAVIVVDDFSGRANDTARLYLETGDLTELAAGFVYSEEEPSFAVFLNQLWEAGYLEEILAQIDESLFEVWSASEGDVEFFLQLLDEQNVQCSVIEPAGVRAVEAGVRAVEAGDAGLPHGEIVVAAMEELRASGLSNAPVDIISLDVPGLDTDEIAIELEAAVFDALEEGYAAVVVNMSWVVLPCGQVPLYYAYYSFASEEQYPISFRQVFSFDQGIETLSDFLQNVRDLAAKGENIVLVGAAGNEGDSISYFPAALPEVISVSASELNDGGGFTDVLLGTSKAGYSNEGEIMLPGLIEITSGGDTFEFEGTSFATPRLSYLIAYQLARMGNSLCTSAGPLALAYSPDENGMDHTLDAVIGNGICIDILDNLP